ncbi:MAG: hypothetical protein II176_06680 [Selenomonas sp.]|nr:hypothetical protein [Selenomonas sp.]MBQ2088338.1 hypothetical protein [Selenomonas sp.]
MKRSGMDERLDAILVRAAMRLEERMRLAYFRGNLSRYLERVGLAQYIDEEKLIKGSLLDLQDDAALAMAYVLRKARNNGYLKEALDKLNMAELLQKENRIKTVLPSSKRQPKVKKVRLQMVKGENKSSALTDEEKKKLLKNFKVIK